MIVVFVLQSVIKRRKVANKFYQWKSWLNNSNFVISVAHVK